MLPLLLALLTPVLHADSEFETPLGLGIIAGQVDPAARVYHLGLTIEGQNHFKQRRGRYGQRQYGHAQTRVELGSGGLELRLSATPGFTIAGLAPAGGRLSAHVGIEPFGGRLAVGTASSQARYYEWLPMASAGIQLGLGGGCRLLPLIRAGGGLGNLGRSPGWTPALASALGAGTYLNCPRVDGAIEVTRLSARDQDVNLFTTDWVYALRPDGFKLGLRAEQDLGRGGGPEGLQDSVERRVLLLLRGELVGWR